MKELKLSELADDIEIAKEESNMRYTVGELKKEILEYNDENHFIGQWFTIDRKQWKPNAEQMIDSYIENEDDDLYEDFYSVAMSEIPKTTIENIQSLLDGVFNNSSVSEYWTCETPVEIDIHMKLE